MMNKEKAQEIAIRLMGGSDRNIKPLVDALIDIANWKDEQSILELGGWHTEPPTEDGWYLVDTPDFPKNCNCVVAEWDNDAKSFYDEHSDYPIKFNKWKLIEKR